MSYEILVRDNKRKEKRCEIVLFDLSAEVLRRKSFRILEWLSGENNEKKTHKIENAKLYDECGKISSRMVVLHDNRLSNICMWFITPSLSLSAKTINVECSHSFTHSNTHTHTYARKCKYFYNRDSWYSSRLRLSYWVGMQIFPWQLLINSIYNSSWATIYGSEGSLFLGVELLNRAYT